MRPWTKEENQQVRKMIYNRWEKDRYILFSCQRKESKDNYAGLFCTSCKSNPLWLDFGKNYHYLTISKIFDTIYIEVKAKYIYFVFAKTNLFLLYGNLLRKIPLICVCEASPHKLTKRKKVRKNFVRVNKSSCDDFNIYQNVQTTSKNNI